MAQSPEVYCPQYDHTLSAAMYCLEERLAEVKHELASANAIIARLKSDKAYWQEEASVKGEELHALKRRTDANRI